ncbi:uncharacterized protein LOC120709019 [Panicum virgatum]|uniref:MADS-box domain-containing protein n=1 Tax=Panicum virgatum TaxID=38727 RepID=A0A8T0SVX1_PANVG|nr:uncharacterized protein LOC120709019 [Panicum virgatum]KAG2602821.1 hypothetical protein PVAP13_5KG710300 [Panicum virgatum]
MTRGKGGPVRAAVDPRYCLVRFMKRKEVLKRKAEALATRCAVDVAVLCTGPGGRGDLDCWPSKEAANEVARRYGALDPAQRAKHTEDHAANVARRLAEERDKLARAREGGVAGALGSWDGSLEAVSEGRLLELLASIEGSLVATKNRALELQAPLAGAADRATLLSVLVHDEGTVDIFVPPRGEADAGGGGLGLGLPPPPSKNPNSPNAEDAGDELQILQPPREADARWMRGLLDGIKKRPQPYNPAAYDTRIESISVGGFMMKLDAYEFMRFDLGMPPPCIAPNPLDDDDGEPLKLWSWGNTMPAS